MKRTIRRFLHEERGAVTIDWVVLTAAIIGIGMLLLGPIALGTGTLAEMVGADIAGTEIGIPKE